MRQIFIDCVDSTNEYLKRLADKDIEPFLMVSALTQTKGKGRMGRIWQDEKNKSFLASLLLPYQDKAFQIGLLLAEAAIQALKSIYPLQAKIKWPNDIYLDGKKLGGVLCEKYRDFLIAGIGINLNQESFPQVIEETAISLFQKTGKKTGVKIWREVFLGSFLNSYKEWETDKPVFIKKRIEPNLEWVGKKIEIDYLNGNQINGTYSGITEDGFLMLETDSGIKQIITGDLKLWLRQ